MKYPNNLPRTQEEVLKSLAGKIPEMAWRNWRTTLATTGTTSMIFHSAEPEQAIAEENL